MTKISDQAPETAGVPSPAGTPEQRETTPQEYYAQAEEHYRAGRYAQAAACAALATAGLALAPEQLYPGDHAPTRSEWCGECYSPKSRLRKGPDGKMRPCSCREQPAKKGRTRACRHCGDYVRWEASIDGWVDGGGNVGCRAAPDPSGPEADPDEADHNTVQEWAEFLGHVAHGNWAAADLVKAGSGFEVTMPRTRFSELPTARQLEAWLSAKAGQDLKGWTVRPVASTEQPTIWQVSRTSSSSHGGQG